MNFFLLQVDQQNELATVSRLEDSVTFYYTSDPDVAQLFHMDPAVRCPALVFLNNKTKKPTIYGTCLHLKFIVFVHLFGMCMFTARLYVMQCVSYRWGVP